MPPVYWHVLLARSAVPFERQFGTLCLMHGHVWFALDYPDQGAVWRPAYLGPIAGSHVVRRPLLGFHRGDVDWWLGGQQLRLVVSRSRINRWISNDVKNLAARQDAHTFVSMLMANGARPGPPPHLRELR